MKPSIQRGNLWSMEVIFTCNTTVGGTSLNVEYDKNDSSTSHFRPSSMKDLKAF